MDLIFIRDLLLVVALFMFGGWSGLTIVRVARRKRSEHFVWRILPVLAPTVAIICGKGVNMIYPPAGILSEYFIDAYNYRLVSCILSGTELRCGWNFSHQVLVQKSQIFFSLFGW